MTSRESELANEVARLLRKEKIQFDRNVAIGGLQPDFLIHSADDRKFIIDVKAWDRFDGFRTRAAHQSDLYKDSLGVDEAFVVVDQLKRSSVAEGVVTVDKLIPAIKDAISKRAPSSGEIKTISKVRKSHVFAAMPFDAKYDDVYFVAMRYAAEKNDAVCIRVDQLEYSGDIVSEIHKQIRRAIAVVADLSESHPNVLYEVGYAHALKKPTVHICSTPLGELPFDVAHWNTIQYRQGQTHLLREQLANHLNNLIK
ncbi:MAG: hypothetical protein PVG14_18855 [Anaerolineales bacterium]|jgi:hypothetical protein